MTYGGFVLAAWLIVGVTLALYATHLVVRGRALTKAVAPERRRWMESSSNTASASLTETSSTTASERER